MDIYNFYYDQEPIRDYTSLKQQHDNALYKYVESDDVYKLFEELDEHTNKRRYNYTKSKYQNCIGYSIEVLLPKVIKKRDYDQFTKLVAEEILQGNKLPWMAHVSRRGLGLYLVVSVGQRKHYDDPKEIAVYRSKNVYRHSISGLWCKEDDPHAELVHEAGTVKSSYLSNWSNKVRLFEKSKQELKLYRLRIENAVRNALVYLNVKVRDSNFFKMIKQHAFKNKTGRRSVYVNVNVDYYNQVIVDMNFKYNCLYELVYSPGKFYQESDTTKALYNLMRKYKQRLEKKKFKHECGISLPFSPFMQSDRFRENIFNLYEHFKEDIEKFISEFIWDGNMDSVSM